MLKQTVRLCRGVAPHRARQANRRKDGRGRCTCSVLFPRAPVLGLCFFVSVKLVPSPPWYKHTPHKTKTLLKQNVRVNPYVYPNSGSPYVLANAPAQRGYFT